MKTLILTAAIVLLGAAPAFADACDDGTKALQDSWARVNYEVPEARRGAQMETLARQAATLVGQCPNRAEPLIWDGIITATAGGLKGGLGGLGLAKDARTLLERAERINPNALEGSALTSLGSLYSQVPGAPIGFGDRNKARSYLQRALAINPNGIDPNYFMGDFLIRQRDYAGAIRFLEKALAAPARPGREIADRGRHAEIQALLTDARRRAR